MIASILALKMIGYSLIALAIIIPIILKYESTL